MLYCEDGFSFRTMHRFAILTGLLCLLYGTTVLARDYHVELVVFERTSIEDERNQQVMRSDRLQTRQAQMETLKTKANTEIGLSDSLTYLDTAENSLIANGYHILKSAHWRQAASVYQDAPLISLVDERKNRPSHLSAGLVRIYKTTLIFADVDLQLTFDRPSRSIEGEATELATNGLSDTVAELNDGANGLLLGEHDPSPENYFISEKRRLKFKEVHYFDHPLFGMILGVWPVEAKKVE